MKTLRDFWPLLAILLVQALMFNRGMVHTAGHRVTLAVVDIVVAAVCWDTWLEHR